MVSATILTLIMLSIAHRRRGHDRHRHAPHARAARARVGAQRRRGRALRAEPRDADRRGRAAAATNPVTGKPQYYPVNVHLVAGAADRRCPNAATLGGGRTRRSPASALFNNVDELKNVTWTTKVRDNGGALATAFDPTQGRPRPGGLHAARRSSPTTACTYDANGDRELWVQSQAIVRGKPRNVVARLRLEQLAESVPQTAVVAGARLDHQQRQPRRHADHRRDRLAGGRPLLRPGRRATARTSRAARSCPARRESDADERRR